MISKATPSCSISTESEEPLRYRWVMLALVWMAYVCFGMTTTSIAPLVDTISQDLGVSSTQMGLVLGVWQLVYVGSAYAMGTLIDRLGLRLSMGLGLAIVTLSLALRATAVDFYSLLFIVALHGIGGPIISIGSPKMVAVWFVGRSRGFGTGFYNTGPQIGAVLVLVLTNSVVVPLTGDWRFSFLVYGAASAIATGVWWLMAKDSPRDPSNENGSDLSDEVAQPAVMPSALETFRVLLKSSNVKAILLLAFATFFMNHGLQQWLPTVFVDKGFSDSTAGYLASVPKFAGMVGLFFIPYLLRHGIRGRSLVALMLASGLANLGLAYLDGGGLVTMLVLSGLARQSLMPILTLILMETPGVGQLHMGAAGGMFFMVAEIGGFTGPLFMGLVRDLTGDLTGGLLMLAAVGGLLSLTALFIKESHQER